MPNQEQDAVQQIKADILQKYNDIGVTPTEVDECFDYAAHDYLCIRYPSEKERPEIADFEIGFSQMQWIKLRMIDIFSRAGGLTAASYKENGMDIKYGASYIDPQLAGMITPKAGVPR